MKALCIVALLLCAARLAADDSDELRKAAQSPYQIERFVRTHANFDWGVLWKALGIVEEEPFFEECEEPSSCSSETVWVRDGQVIERLNDSSYNSTVFLRFQEIGELSNEWRFLGYFRPAVKYFRPEHKLMTIDHRTFLLVSEQGSAGTGISVAWQNVFDLGRPTFKPVLRFVEDGWWNGWFGLPGHEVHGFLASIERGSRDTIKIHYTVRHFEKKAGDLGHCQADAVFTRTGSGNFRFAPELSSAPLTEIKSVYVLIDPADDNPYNYDSDFVHYNFQNLKRIATGPANPARTWLKRYVASHGGSAERRELQRLLAARR